MNGPAILALIAPVAALVMMGIGAYCGAKRKWCLLVGCTLAWLLVCAGLLFEK